MMSSSPTNPGPSPPRTKPGTGRALCVVCGIRPHYDDGRRTFPTCGNTCKKLLEAMTESPPSSPIAESSEAGNRPLCVICKRRPQFNNGRRAFSTCGKTCARALKDQKIPDGSSMNSNGATPEIKMCYVCNVKPRNQREGKAYLTCGVECAARLHSLESQAASQESQAAWPIGTDSEDRFIDQFVTIEIYEDNMGESKAKDNMGESKARAVETFNCIICLETLGVDHIARFACRHTFCRSCIREHIKSELSSHHYPIVCPSCKIDDGKNAAPSAVDENMLQILGLGQSELNLFYELQLTGHSIAICCQKCKETMFVDRRDYQEMSIINCPLPRCNYIWCKHCQKGVEPKGPRHSCDGSTELEHLMKQHGWRHCPGCQIPVQKSDGCNHMTCSAPGCNTHFCYQCGANIIKSVLSAEIKEAITTHYNACQLF